MTARRESVDMYQSHDIHHESRHVQCPRTYMPNHGANNIHSPINRLNNNHNYYVKLGSRSDMGKL